MEQEVFEKLDRIERLLEDLAATTAKSFNVMEEKLGTEFEGMNGRIDGVNRGIDAELERHGALEVRVTKLEDAQ